MKYIEQVNNIMRRKWHSPGRGWKIFFASLLVVIGLISLAYFIVWGLTKLLKSLSSGVGQGSNLGLYYPANRRRR